MPLTTPPANPAAPGTAPSRAVRSTFAGLADAAWLWLFGTWFPFMTSFRTWYGDTAKPELEALQTDVAAKQTAAANSAANAAGSATTSSNNLAAFQPQYDIFKTRSLGAFAADPALDNQGNALVAGAWYTNTATNAIRAYTGTAWVNGIASIAGVSTFNGQAGAITFAAGLTVAPTRAANTQLVAADKASFIRYTGGTFAQTIAAVAALGDIWEVFLFNDGTGVITLDPDGAEQIDGLSSFAMYSGEIRKVYRDGAALKSTLIKSFEIEPSATMNFVEPPGYRAYEVFIAAPGGGGGAGRRGASATDRCGGAGGASGSSVWAMVNAGAPGNVLTVTVGADGIGAAAVTVDSTSGVNGGAGGAHRFGTFVAATGGIGGLGGGTGSPNGASGGAATPGGQIVFGGTNSGSGQFTGGLPGTAAPDWAATGGGGGGGITAANVANNGGAGGASGTNTNNSNLAGGIGGVAAGTRTGGDGQVSEAQRGGTGGGGGASHATLAGSAGGIGRRGGGGGGGAASVNGVNSGAGGNGQGYFYIGGIF